MNFVKNLRTYAPLLADLQEYKKVLTNDGRAFIWQVFISALWDLDRAVLGTCPQAHGR